MQVASGENDQLGNLALNARASTAQTLPILICPPRPHPQRRIGFTFWERVSRDIALSENLITYIYTLTHEMTYIEQNDPTLQQAWNGLRCLFYLIEVSV